MEFESVKPRSHRRVVLPELPSFSLIVYFEYGNAKRPIPCHDRAVQENSASGEVLLKVERMLIHQEPLLIRYVLGKGGSWGNQREEVMLFAHGNGNSSAGRPDSRERQQERMG